MIVAAVALATAVQAAFKTPRLRHSIVAAEVYDLDTHRVVYRHDAETLMRVGADHIMGYLIKPISEADLKAAIALAIVRFQHFLALSREASDLRQALEDRKVIEKAKGVVMKRLHTEEEEAFRRLRKFASDQNLKLVEVGRRIIAAEEIFHELERS